MSTSTSAQQEAIAARGNVLVVAGAGAGKTRTLVERCMAWLLEDPAQNSLDQILMVTFTEAAGAEMRKRLRDRLEKLASNSPGWNEQLALLETAHISTLHSFCLRLVRQHFYELGLDPQLTILADDQSQLLARKALDELLDEQYRGNTIIAAAVQDLIEDHGRGWDQPVRELIGRIHNYTQTLADCDGWFTEQFERLSRPEPDAWRGWLMEELQGWRRLWLPLLQTLAPNNPNARQCFEALAELTDDSPRDHFAYTLARIVDVDKDWPPKQKGRLRSPIEKIFDEAQFLHSVCAVDTTDPLAEDWDWVRPQMLALLQLAQQFTNAYANEKQRIGGLDFHDLEQFALRLLWDKKTGRRTAVAEQWQKKFRLIFVDEYQDINAAQDAIIRGIGGEGAMANRFLVGDIKQSIYRFRLANPRIFLNYQSAWREAADAKVITLSENFRSHEGILGFVNALFDVLMKREVGGIGYDEAAWLRFGNREGRGAFALQPGSAPPVELHVLSGSGGGEESAPQSICLSETEAEARWVAQRLLDLKNQPAMVQDHDAQRPATWKDMVILLRSPRGKVEAYVKEFNRLGVPLVASRGGFYESLEIRDLLALLQILDNPLQDFPLLAVLRSPLAGLSADDLATVRVANRQGRFWTALTHWHEVQKAGIKDSEPGGTLFKSVSLFLERFQAWRRSTRHMALSHCLEMVLDQTHYAEWLLTQERGEQRRANVERLLQLTRQFDVFQREGLFRFLKYVEGQENIQVEPASPPVADAVRLMSIHQSKGLEFPIVVLADLGKGFNFSDARGKIVLDEVYGLCPQIKPPHARQFYPSLPFWLAQRRQKRETLGEELRLLYVGLTRASERLVLVGTGSNKSLERWSQSGERGFDVAEILGGRSCLDWLGGRLMRANGLGDLAASGTNSFLQWTLCDGAANAASMESQLHPPGADAAPITGDDIDQLQARLLWKYPAEAATRWPAKTSVSALRREMADEEAAPLFDASKSIGQMTRKNGKLSAAETGSAHHSFLEWVSLEKVGSVAELVCEAERLRKEQKLTTEQVGCLNFEALADFWKSEIGQSLLRHKGCLRRELAFTARFGGQDLAGLSKAAEVLAKEFVVVQGVIDLCAILSQEIWVLDFKTDQITESNLEEKACAYKPQLELYSRAIGRIYNKPVTKTWLHFLAIGKTIALGPSHYSRAPQEQVGNSRTGPMV